MFELQSVRKYPSVPAPIEQNPANRLQKVSWLASSRNDSSTRDIFEQTTVFNNAAIIKNANILIFKEHLCISPESDLGCISNRNK